MARQKSTSGSKTPRTKKKEEVGVAASMEVANVNPPVAQVASGEVKPEPKLAVEPAKVAEHKTTVESKPFEVRMPEPRKNLVPINLDEEIRRRAYELYQMRGAQSGHEAQDWLIAEREVMQRYHHQQSA